MRRDHKIALANANVARKREREAREKGDLEGARIMAEVAADYEEDADFWAAFGDDDPEEDQ